MRSDLDCSNLALNKHALHKNAKSIKAIICFWSCPCYLEFLQNTCFLKVELENSSSNLGLKHIINLFLECSFASQNHGNPFRIITANQADKASSQRNIGIENDVTCFISCISALFISYHLKTLTTLPLSNLLMQVAHSFGTAQ